MSDDKKMDLVTYTSGLTTLTLFDSLTGVAVTRELSADDLESLSDASDEAAAIVRQIAREKNYEETVQRFEEDE